MDRTDRRNSDDPFKDLLKWWDRLGNSTLAIADPVFEGIIKDFEVFDRTAQQVLGAVSDYIDAVCQLCSAMGGLSEVVVNDLTKNSDDFIRKDCILYRETVQKITRSDAPHSAAAKLIRDMEFNVIGPLRKHISNNRILKDDIECRKRRLENLVEAQKRKEYIIHASIKNDKMTAHAAEQLEQAKAAYREVDRPLFEWLVMLDAYKNDIYDSLLQTVKYLQYEFFATAAHSIHSVFPQRIEFRPLIEMTPAQLQSLVQMEIEEQIKLAEENKEKSTHEKGRKKSKKVRNSSSSDDDSVLSSSSASEPNDDSEAKRVYSSFEMDATNKILDRWEREGAFQSLSTNDVLVDPMSLSVLVDQGFDEASARKALKKHNNDTQSALDWLLAGMPDSKPSLCCGMIKGIASVNPVIEDGVRLPTTLKWVRKLKEKKQRDKEKARQFIEANERERLAERKKKREKGRSGPKTEKKNSKRRSKEENSLDESDSAVDMISSSKGKNIGRAKNKWNRAYEEGTSSDSSANGYEYHSKSTKNSRRKETAKKNIQNQDNDTQSYDLMNDGCNQLNRPDWDVRSDYEDLLVISSEKNISDVDGKKNSHSSISQKQRHTESKVGERQKDKKNLVRNNVENQQHNNQVQAVKVRTTRRRNSENVMIENSSESHSVLSDESYESKDSRLLDAPMMHLAFNHKNERKKPKKVLRDHKGNRQIEKWNGKNGELYHEEQRGGVRKNCKTRKNQLESFSDTNSETSTEKDTRTDFSKDRKTKHSRPSTSVECTDLLKLDEFTADKQLNRSSSLTFSEGLSVTALPDLFDACSIVSDRGLSVKREKPDDNKLSVIQESYFA